MTAALDPKRMIDALRAARKMFPLLKPFNHLYTVTDSTSALYAEPATAQIEKIRASRIGDLVLSGYNAARTGAQIAAMCCCGTQVMLRPRIVTRLLLSAPRSAYFAPVGVHRLFPAVEASPSSYPCPHIQNKLREAHPHQFAVWREMKKQVQTRISAYPDTVHQVNIEPAWFHRATGFAQFLIDVGLPCAEGQKLTRTDKHGDFTPLAFTYVHPADSVSGRNLYPNLSTRFYSLRSHAKKAGRYFHWRNFAAFCRDVRIPDDFESDPKAWRLSWSKAGSIGYTPNNYKWVPTDYTEPDADKSKPWNQIAELQQEIDSLPLREYGVTLDQYMEALIELGMIMADQNRSGEFMEDMVVEALQIAKRSH